MSMEAWTGRACSRWVVIRCAPTMASSQLGGDHVDMIGLDPGAVFDLHDVHGRGAAENLRQRTLALRVEMRNENVGHAEVGLESLEKRREGFKAAGGSADAHSAKGGRRSGFGGVGFAGWGGFGQLAANWFTRAHDETCRTPQYPRDSAVKVTQATVVWIIGSAA